jgi:hypothetical protein
MGRLSTSIVTDTVIEVYGVQVAGDSHVLFLRDSVVLGHGWRQRRMVAGGVGPPRTGTELVRLHQSAVIVTALAVAEGPSGAILDQEAMVEKS